MDLTLHSARELFTYEPDSGRLFWKIETGHHAKGAIVGWRDRHGYQVFKIKGKYYQAHRVIWLMHYGSWPAHRIKHLDGNRANNHISNLHDATYLETQQQRATSSNNASGFNGVSWNKRRGKWISRVNIGGYTFELGSFADQQAAIKARKQADQKKKQLNPEFVASFVNKSIDRESLRAKLMQLIKGPETLGYRASKKKRTPFLLKDQPATID